MHIFLKRPLLLMELMVEHVSNKSQFGFMLSFTSASFIFCTIVSPICSDYDPMRVLNVEDGQFTI